jgi:NDP-sugar pyrophosphorylase family protein
VTGFILAAGFGTRLKPLTDHVPKALVPVCGEPLLKRAYDFFVANGITKVAVNSHYHPGQVNDFVAARKLDCTIFHEQGKIRGTGGALYYAKEFLAKDEYFCVANVDIIGSLDLKALFNAFAAMHCAAGLVSVASKRGTVWYDAETKDYIGARSEKSALPGGCRGEPGGAEFMGIAFYKKKFLDLLTEQDFSILPVWKRCQQQGMPVKIIEAGNPYWIDLGTPAHLASIHFDMLDGKYTLAVPESLLVDRKTKKAYPRSFNASTVKKLGAYSWIETLSIPDSSRISRSVVFSDAVVPENTSINNAIVTKYGVISFGS